MKKLLRIAIQNKGRLNEDSVKLFHECGIDIFASNRQLLSPSTNFPIEVLYLRDDDIPEIVSRGVADIGIIGENEMWEKDKKIVLSKRLGFGKCRMSLAIPASEVYEGIDWFKGKIVSTSYPFILNKFFKSRNIKAKIHVMAGSVEIAPRIGLSDGIFDIVSSGSTLTLNGLKEVEIVSSSEAVLISVPNLISPKQIILNELIFRIESLEHSRGKKYIMLNAPNKQIKQIVNILPGIKSPTIVPLAIKGWSSVHSVIEEKYLWENISKFKSLGAEGILVLPIEMIMT